MTMVVEERTKETQHLSMLYCDSCTAARAMFRIWVDRWRIDEHGNGTSLEIVLCAHHMNKHRAFVESEGYEVDEIV